MAFLKVNGVTVPVLNEASLGIEEIGTKERTADGSLVSQLTARKRSWSVRVQHTDKVTATKYRRLILGDGDFYPWDSAHGLYSSRGQAPVTVGGLVANVGAGAWGVGSARIPAGGSDADLFIPDLGTSQQRFTFGFFYSTTGIMWSSHWMYRSDGQNFSNGIATGSSLSDWFSYTGNLRLEGHGSDNHYYSALFILPYAIPDAWAPMLYGAGAFGLLPQVKVNGEITDEGLGQVNVDARGEVEGQDIIKASLASGGRQPVHVVRAKLSEV